MYVVSNDFMHHHIIGQSYALLIFPLCAGNADTMTEPNRPLWGALAAYTYFTNWICIGVRGNPLLQSEALWRDWYR